MQERPGANGAAAMQFGARQVAGCRGGKGWSFAERPAAASASGTATATDTFLLPHPTPCSHDPCVHLSVPRHSRSIGQPSSKQKRSPADQNFEVSPILAHSGVSIALHLPQTVLCISNQSKEEKVCQRGRELSGSVEEETSQPPPLTPSPDLLFSIISTTVVISRTCAPGVSCYPMALPAIGLCCRVP